MYGVCRFAATTFSNLSIFLLRFCYFPIGKTVVPIGRPLVCRFSGRICIEHRNENNSSDAIISNTCYVWVQAHKIKHIHRMRKRAKNKCRENTLQQRQRQMNYTQIGSITMNNVNERDERTTFVHTPHTLVECTFMQTAKAHVRTKTHYFVPSQCLQNVFI